MKQRDVFKALTIIRRGRLSKTKLSLPSDGLPEEDKKAQEVPVMVTLKPICELDPVTQLELPKSAETAPETSGPGIESDDPFALPGDVDGNKL